MTGAGILYIVVLIVVAAGGILTLWLVLRHYRHAERLRAVGHSGGNVG